MDTGRGRSKSKVLELVWCVKQWRLGLLGLGVSLRDNPGKMLWGLVTNGRQGQSGDRNSSKFASLDALVAMPLSHVIVLIGAS